MIYNIKVSISYDDDLLGLIGCISDLQKIRLVVLIYLELTSNINY